MKNDLQSLSYMVSRYFRFYLPGERGFSMMTITSYRDTFKQFLSYCSETIGKPPEKLCISDLSKESVAAFLTNLEADGKSISTRNQRLASIKSFFNYVKYAFPEYPDVASGVLRMRMKK
jgi:integrase/recombinase XerD